VEYSSVLLYLLGPLRRDGLSHLQWQKGAVHQEVIPPETDMVTTGPRHHRHRWVSLDGGGHTGPSLCWKGNVRRRAQNHRSVTLTLLILGGCHQRFVHNIKGVRGWTRCRK
jgi:hypothetical protein